MKLFNNRSKLKLIDSEYNNYLFEQYKILIGSTEKISDRRNSANNYYITINTALITLIGLSYQIIEIAWIRPLIYISGIILSVIFYLLINSYKQLNTGKFSVIHEVESVLPVSLYKYEWYILGEGKDRSKYYPFSHIELIIPTILGGLYLILLLPQIISIIAKICLY